MNQIDSPSPTLLALAVATRITLQRPLRVCLITLTGIGLFITQNTDSSLWFIYASALLYGLGHSAGSPTYGATIADIFGGRTFGTIIGFLEISFGVGMAFGPWFGGFVLDLTSSYRWAFVVVFAGFLLSFVSIQKEFGLAPPLPAPDPDSGTRRCLRLKASPRPKRNILVTSHWMHS